MINGSWQRRSTTENTESTERYCFLSVLCALCGYKPFQEIIESLENRGVILSEVQRSYVPSDQQVVATLSSNNLSGPE